MSNFIRLVNDPLRLRLVLTDKDTDKFVRALLTDQAGTPLGVSPVDLTHQGKGVYIDNATLMPNSEQVEVQYCIFNDAGFTDEDDSHSSDFDIFELDQFDPTNLLPKTNAVFAEFERKNIVGILSPNPIVRGLIRANTALNGVVSNGAIQGNVITQGKITGVVYDE